MLVYFSRLTPLGEAVSNALFEIIVETDKGHARQLVPLIFHLIRPCGAPSLKGKAIECAGFNRDFLYFTAF